MRIPVLMPRRMTSEAVLAGELLRLLVPVSLRWPTRFTWPMTKATTSQPAADAISRQLMMLARPEPLVLLPPLVVLPPRTLVPRTLVPLSPRTLVPLVPLPPSMLVPLLPLVVPSMLVTGVQQRIMIPPRRLARA
jgi:hypothetical protein